MKNKIKIIVMAVAVLLLLILTIIFGGEKKTDEDKIIEERKETERNWTLERLKTVPKVEDEEEDDPSKGTGVLYISPTKDEYDEAMAIAKIRDESPIETDDFKVFFDYKTNLVTVDFTDKENEGNLEIFEDWKFEEGYNIIDDKYWKTNL